MSITAKDGEVRYTAKEFIGQYKGYKGVAQKIATQYVAEHPKDSYGHEDADAMYYLLPSSELGGRHDASRHFSGDDDISFDRAVKLYEQRMGE